jgi:alpha-glucosidase
VDRGAAHGTAGATDRMPWIAEAAHAGFSSGRPWLPVPEAHLALAVDRQESEPNSQLALARRLIALRNRLPGLRIGDMRIIEAGTEVLLFERTHETEELLCAFNFGRHAHTLPAPPPGRWRLLEAVGGASAWTLPPWSGLIAQRLGLA